MSSKTIGNYTITVEKLDKCPCKYHDIIEILAFLDMLMIPAILFVLSAQLNSFSLGCFAAAAPFIWLIMVSEFTNHLRDCGCKISLRGGGISRSKYYQFTDNPNTDVAEVQKLVDKYTDTANKLHTQDMEIENKDADHKKVCCAKFKGILEKVKYE